MLSRMREVGRGLGGRDWLRILYLANISALAAVALIYLGGWSLPVSENTPLQRPLSALICYLCLLLLWYLLDGLGVVDAYDWLAGLRLGVGLRGFDILLAALAVLALAFSLQLRPVPEAVLMAAGLVLINAVIALLQHRRPYSEETLAVAPDDGGAPTAEAGRPDAARDEAATGEEASAEAGLGA